MIRGWGKKEKREKPQMKCRRFPELQTGSAVPPPDFPRSRVLLAGFYFSLFFFFKYCLRNESDLNAGLFRRDSKNVPVSPANITGGCCHGVPAVVSLFTKSSSEDLSVHDIMTPRWLPACQGGDISHAHH